MPKRSRAKKRNEKIILGGLIAGILLLLLIITSPGEFIGLFLLALNATVPIALRFSMSRSIDQSSGHKGPGFQNQRKQRAGVGLPDLHALFR